MRPPKKNFDDFLELESDASEVESWLDNSMYQKCGDVPEEDDMGRERGNVFSLSPSFFYIFDTSLETISPLGFTSGGRQKKMMRFDSKKGRRVLAHSEDEQDVDDPMTSTPFRSPLGEGPHSLTVDSNRVSQYFGYPVVP